MATTPRSESSAKSRSVGCTHENQGGVARGPELAGRDHQEGEEDAAGDRNQGRPGEGRRGRAECNQDADEADADDGHARPVDPLAEPQSREPCHVDRTCKVIRHHVGEGQVHHRPVEARDFEGRERNADEFKSGLGRKREGKPAPPDQNEKHGECRKAAQEKHLAHRVGRDQPFSQHIVDGKQEDAEHHQADAGENPGPGGRGGRGLNRGHGAGRVSEREAEASSLRHRSMRDYSLALVFGT
jgi:hypothetical protein